LPSTVFSVRVTKSLNEANPHREGNSQKASGTGMRIQTGRDFQKVGDSRWFEMEPAVGFEPTTDGLQSRPRLIFL
jgi:hypothetical protein